jgi:undecaprenyl-diphosphatase
LADLTTFLQAVILGVVEGVTEFIPVSSTGHLILAGHLIGFEGAVAGTFEVVIQLGAILAVCVLYFERLLRVVVRLPYDPAARRFVLALLTAFLPSVVLGALLHDVIKEVLFSPWVVVVSLVLGGIAILAIEAVSPEPRQHSAEGMPVALALKIGFCQVISMVPGVSRSGATILGAVLLGVDRKAAAEFSFFLAIPTMMAASAYDLYKSSGALAGSDFAVIAVGFVVSLITAVIVIRAFLAFLVRHTFRAFGWYRIGAGIAMAIVLLLEGGPQEPPVTSPPEPAALLAPASGDRPRLSVDSPTPSEVRVESLVGLSTSRS